MRTRRRRDAFLPFLLGKTSWSRLVAALAVATVGLAPGAATLQAGFFNWTGPGGSAGSPTSGNWNVATNWNNGVPPLNDTSTTLDFGGSTATPYTSTHNLGVMQLSALSFSSSAPATETINAAAGSSLRLVDDIFFGPTITQNGTGSFVVNVPIEIVNNVTYSSAFGGVGLGSINLAGNLTGSGNLLTNSTASTLILSGNNSGYSGNIVVAPGSGTGITSPNMSVLSARSANALGTGNLNLLNSAGVTSTDPGFAIGVLEIGADLDGNAGNGWDFTRAIGTGAGQVNLSGSNNRAIIGFSAVGGNRSVNIGGNATPIELVQKQPLLPNGAGDGWSFGSPTSDSTLIMINPLAGPDNANRNLRTIRGVGNVPEGMLRGTYRNNNRVDINGTGGLILDNVGTEAWRQGMDAGTNIIRHISGGLFLAVSDPANGSASPIGRSNATLTVGESAAVNSSIPMGSINTGIMTYGPGTSGNSPTPIITIARNLTIGTGGTGIMSVGGFTADNTLFSGTINLNNVPTRFTSRTGGRVEFSGIVSNGGALTIGNTTIEGDDVTPGIAVQGGGTVVLSGNNTYTGGTTVTHGTLLVNNTAGSGTGTGAVTVQSGATLGGSGMISPTDAFATVTINSGGILSPHTIANGTSALTIGNNGLVLDSGALLNFNFGAPGVSDVVNLTGAANSVTLNGNITLNIGDQPGFGFGTYPLFNFTGGSVLGGGQIQIGANPGAQFTYNIVNQPGQILLDVVSSAALKTWTGATNANWDTTTPNWSPSNFANGNQVEFTNSANPENSNINIVAPVSPALITVDNSTIPTYTFGGAAIQGSASIIKENTGTLVLTGANTYTGATAINGGTLRVTNSSGSATGSGTVSINTGATLSGSGTVSPTGANTVIVQPGAHIAPHIAPTGTNTLTIGSNGLTILGGAQLDFNFAAPGVGDSIELTGTNNTLNIAGDIGLNFTQQAGFNTGTYKLFGFGSRTGQGRININGSLPTHLLRIAESPTRIDLVAALIQTWNGAQNSTWNAGSAANWTPGGTWTNGSAARFDDSYAGPNRNITVAGEVTTDGIIVNASGDYSIGGSGIAGPGGVQKSGTGLFTLTGANTFTGATRITGGTLAINSDSSLGMAPASFVADHLTIDGGTLRALASATLSNNRGITTGAGNVTIDVANDSDTLSVNSTIVGAGRLSKTGPGNLQLGDTSNSFAGLTVSGGTVEAIPEGASPQSVNIGNNAAASSIIGASANAPLIIDGGTLKLTTKGSASNLTIGRTITFGPNGGTFDLTNTEGGTLGGGVVNGVGGGGGLMNVDLTNTVGPVVVRWNGGQSGLSTNDPANGDWAEGSNNLQWNSVTVGAQAPPLRIELSHAGMTTFRAEQFGTYNGALTIRGGVGGDVTAAGNQVTEIGRVQVSGTGTLFTFSSGMFLEDSLQFNLAGNTRTFDNNIILRGTASGHPANITFNGRATGTAFATNQQAFQLTLGTIDTPNNRTLTIEKGATANFDVRIRTDQPNSNGVEVTSKLDIKAGGAARARQSWLGLSVGASDRPVGYVEVFGDIVGNGNASDGESLFEVQLPFSDRNQPRTNEGGVTFRGGSASQFEARLVVNGDNSGSGAGLLIRGAPRDTKLYTVNNQQGAAALAFPTDPVSSVTKLSGNPDSIASVNRLAALTGSGGYLTLAAVAETFPFPASAEWAANVPVGLKVINSNTGGDDVSLSSGFTHNINVDAGAILNAGGVSFGPAVTTAGLGLIKGLGTISGNPTFGNGSTVAPGFGTGTLSTSGNATINGTLQAEINAQGRDQLNSFGNLTLGPSSTLNLPGTNVYDNATTLIVAAYTGTRTGNFGSTSALPAGYTLNYGTGTNSFITLRPANPLNEWFRTDGSSWNTGGNWVTGAVPNSNADTARLWSALMSDGTVDLGSTNATVKALSFRNGTASYNLSGSGGGRLSLTSNVGNASIVYEVDNLKDHTISTGLTLGSNADITLGSGRTLTLTGQQNWGGQAIMLNSGTLRYASTAAGSNTGGSSLTIAPVAAVELAGGASATSDGTNSVNITNNGKLTSSGTQSIGTLSGTGTSIVDGTSNLTAGHIRQSSLDIGASSKVTTRLGSATSVLNTLKLTGTPDAPTATLDLTNSAMVLDYPTAGPNPAADVRQQIISGRGGSGLGKPWNGPGITSSKAQFDVTTSPNSTSVAYAVNGDLPLGAYSNFRGQPVDPTSVLIRYTRTADANLDGVVNDDDVTIVGANYAPGIFKASWALGDFDYNGFVDDDDVTLLGVFYNPAATPIPAPAAGQAVSGPGIAAVPEPAGELLVIAAALTALVALRRRMRLAHL